MPSPAKDEAEEVSELLALFGHQTDVPRGMLLKFQVSKANREKADAERKAKEERQKLLEERMAEQHERIQKLRSATKDLDREATARLKAANRKNASRIKAEEKEWENLRQLKHNAMVKDVHARGSADFHNARIGEIEAKMLKDRRDKQQKEHHAFLEREKKRNAAKRSAINQQAGRVREEVEHAKKAAAEKLEHLKTSMANEAREAKSEWKKQFEQNEKERLARANANRQHAEEVRSRMRKNLENQKAHRLKEGDAMKVRNMAAINATRSADLERKRQMRKHEYGRRFASASEAEALQKTCAMTIQYDAEALVGWCSLTTLFCRCRGTIFIGVFCTPVFWIVNIIHGALILSPWLVNEYNRLRAEGSGSGEGYEEFELPPLDWGVSIVGLGLLFFFIVFYNNISYQRFYTLYGHCVGVGGTTMEWTGLVRSLLPKDKISQWNAVRLILAAQHILFYALPGRGAKFEDDEWQVVVDRCMLSRNEVAALKKYGGFKPYIAITWAMEEARSQTEAQSRSDESLNRDLGQGMREEIIHSQFREVAFRFRAHCGQIISLLQEPVPFPYFHLLNVMIFMQLCLTAYTLAARFGPDEWYFATAVMVLISIFLLGIQGLAVQLSNPIGDFNLEKFMAASFNDAVAYLKEDSFRPTGDKVAEPEARIPLFTADHQVGQSQEEASAAWCKPRSAARRKALKALAASTKKSDTLPSPALSRRTPAREAGTVYDL